MTSVSIDKEMLDDLVDFKLRHVLSRINEILENWNHDSADDFLRHARDGTLQEAEMDAIALRQLILQRETLEKLKEGWK